MAILYVCFLMVQLAPIIEMGQLEMQIKENVWGDWACKIFLQF